jgi:hypothetical protein
MASVLFAVATAATALSAQAHEEEDEVIDELIAYGRSLESIGKSLSASEGLVGYDDIRLTPALRVGELVEAVPGMVATQHSGTGKANQYFMRGFNLDHGTDFSATVDGVPVNMRTHGHGQGYLDLNFIIPEMVATSAYRKGPYHARVGDFSSAGSVDFSYYERLSESLAAITVGQNQYIQGFAAASLDFPHGVLTGALDATRYDGPWDIEEDLVQDKAFLRYAFDAGPASANIDFHGYRGSWDSTDQIPRRAVQSGVISSLGYIDPDLGGKTHRYGLTGALDFGSWHATAFVVDYDFTLFSNFTYLLDDPVAGDEFEQRDDRRMYGGHVGGTVKRPYGDREVTYRWGVQLRDDDISEVGLYGTEARERNGTIRQDAVGELSIGVWAEAELPLTDRLRAIAGLRTDYYEWTVNALRSENSGDGADSLTSPKFTLAYRLREDLEGYVNWGRGFHSNDVRGTTINTDPVTGDTAAPVEALVESEGAEAGIKLERESRFNASIVAFWLELDSELVFVGDAGNTESNEGTRRFGIEASTFWQVNDWLALNASYTTTDAEFRQVTGSGTEIPGAVESAFSMGLTGAWDNGWSASLRFRYLGESPLVEDGSVNAADSLLLNGSLLYRIGTIQVRLDAFNLLDSDDYDISYYYESRLPGETVGLEDVHFHPLEPRQLRLSVTKRWAMDGR